MAVGWVPKNHAFWKAISRAQRGWYLGSLEKAIRKENPFWILQRICETDKEKKQ